MKTRYVSDSNVRISVVSQVHVRVINISGLVTIRVIRLMIITYTRNRLISDYALGSCLEVHKTRRYILRWSNHSINLFMHIGKSCLVQYVIIYWVPGNRISLKGMMYIEKHVLMKIKPGLIIVQQITIPVCLISHTRHLLQH